MQIEQKAPPLFEERIDRMKKKVVSHSREICIERAKLFTDSYKQTKIEPPVIRFAKAVSHFLTNMTIVIWEDEYIVGNRTTKYVGTPLYPEVRIDTIEQDIDTYGNRFIQQLHLSEEDKKLLKEDIIPYWKNEEITVYEKFKSSLDDDLREVVDKLVFTVEVQYTNGIGHFFPGHRNVLRYGYNGLKQMAKDRLESLNENEQEFEKKCNFLQSVIIVLDAVIKFVKRVSHHALSMANETEDPQRKKELKEISEICQNIAEAPPTTFKEALQLIYFNQLICGLEDGGFAVSVGRLDQDLYPYYAKDLKDGILDQSEVDFLLKCFFIKLTGLWNYIFALGANAGEGPPIAENLTIGGLDRAGKDATNELSFQILEAYTHLQTVQPTFSARIHQKTSKRFLETLSDSIKNGTSIALFNDEVMVPGLVNRGFTLEDAREYAPVGCVEPQHPYKSFGSTNSNQLNIVKCLELALTNGMDLFARKEYGASSDIKIESYEDLWKAFEKQVSYFIENMVKSMNYLDCAIAELDPQPFLSATTSNCIQNAQDVTQGGSVYNFTGPQLIGLATAADSLAVIKKLVFEEQQLELEDLIQILKKNYRGNYKGKTGKEWREIFINKVPKFGNDIDYVDQIAVNVAELFCREVSKWDNFRGGKYNPGIYSTSLHLAFGTFTGASADGRKSRDTLSNGVGPTHGRDTNGPTAILNSVKKLKNELMTNGHSLILAFHPNNLEREIFVPLVKTYCEPEGGFQIQFNVIGKQTLCDAQEHPQKYQGLVVRIAGYSVYFTELSKAAQDEIIARTIF